MELEKQQQPVQRRAGPDAGWSPWSAWSPCSRTCDGGASFQLRRCETAAGCRGEPVRYKICNMQPCPEAGDFRDEQCAALSGEPWEGELLRWSAHEDEAAPCALTCRATRPDGSLVVARLADRVRDGTRCRPGSLDMCISGQCQRVGCDLRIGSSKRVDACGVCGGDSSSCAQPLFHWEHAPASLCSAPCGGGRKMSRAVCRNRVTGADADEQLCNASQRPPRLLLPCNTHRCPAKWVPDPWGPCSVSCGGGHTHRIVRCLQDINGTTIQVPDSQCPVLRPHHSQPCNSEECPIWNSGPWSECSLTCGVGVQTRAVWCAEGTEPSALCDPTARPPPKQTCLTGVICPGPEYQTGKEEDKMPGGDNRHSLIQTYGPSRVPSENEENAKQPSPFKMFFACGWLYLSFMAKKWGPCSVTCGVGVRKREVHCKTYLEFVKTYARVPDAQCHGKKPAEIEKCKLDPCNDELSMDSDGTQSYQAVHEEPSFDMKIARTSPGPYIWKSMGYKPCSASCLGGMQESFIICVHESTQKTVNPYFCDKESRPETLYRTCNEFPCPPRWNYSEYQACSKPCGIGIRTREVTCIHEVTRGGSNTIIVPNSMCPQPPPPNRQYCNIVDCPVKWHTGTWSKCSATCGGGTKTRSVECKQTMAQNNIIPRHTTKCTGPKPPEKKACNKKPCSVESIQPQIHLENKTYVQENANEKKVNLKIGGQAIVFAGSQVKIRCPVRKFNRTKIQWEKNSTQITTSRKYKVTKQGALKIHDIMFTDSGKYTCIAGQSKADLYLSVKLPLTRTSSEEVENANKVLPGRSRSEDRRLKAGGPRHAVIFPGDDRSHETQPEEKQGRKMTVRPTTTVATSPPSPNHEEEVNVKNVDNWQLFNNIQMSDQKQEEFRATTVLRGGDSVTLSAVSSTQMPDTFEGTVPHLSSGSARPMPHFQHLLSNLQTLWLFQTFSNSRGHRTVSDSIPIVKYGKPDEDMYEDEFGPAVVLGRGSAENLKFDWMITEWSKCSQTCGGGGFQTRTAHCMVRLNNNTQNVQGNLCEDAGLPTPPLTQQCGLEECPQWITSSWSSCEDSRCFTWNKAMQRREVACLLSNGTEVEGLCSEAEKPTQRRECHNEKCKGTWRVGEWSECTATCEMQGIKYRILQCVWYGTKKPAGNACRGQPRPSVMKMCKGPPCTQKRKCKVAMLILRSPLPSRKVKLMKCRGAKINQSTAKS
ncbi:protein madd-4-like [Schistocerca nitens]|uniref:protein madd-4-like n=1 Tax=Schistocerca nitens TaxID=7011 RepID=UPI0021188E91|nr:protein madd-4-like [Schistocerca nitens]